MRKQALARYVALFIGLVYSSTALGGEIEKGSLAPAVWRVSLKLDDDRLVPPAVQYAVFDEDPLIGFKSRLEKAEDRHQQELQKELSEAKKNMTRDLHLSFLWDRGFRKVTGDEVYLLTSAPGVSHSISSNSPDGTKWIATKIVNIKGGPACWCLPLKVISGGKLEVVLTKNNAYDLGAAYKQAMAAAN